MELMDVANILIKKINNEYKEDVAVMCIYGSYIYNETYEKSDLDFYFIPKTERGYELAKTFIIDDIGFDFWPITWERAENIAKFEEECVSLIGDAKVVYYNNDMDLEKFEELRAQVKSSDIDISNKTKEMFEKCKYLLSEIIMAENQTHKKIKSVNFVKNIIHVLNVANKKYTRRGYSISVDECENLDIKPLDIKSKLNKILFEKNEAVLNENCINLLCEVEKLIICNDNSHGEVANALCGFYEEAKSLYNKIYNACEVGDDITTFMAITLIQEDLMHCIGEKEYYTYFSDLINSFDKDNLMKFKEIVQSHEDQFKKIIKDNNIYVCEYSSIDEFEKDIIK